MLPPKSSRSEIDEPVASPFATSSRPRGDRRLLRGSGDRAGHRNARERLVERERSGRLPAHVRLGHGERELAVDAAQHDLGEVHQVLVRGVRLVELQHRELGVVPRRDALVPVAAADLVDPLEPADDEALQEQLRRDPHEEIQVERVVVSQEGAGHGAADERVHGRRLDLQKPRLVENLPGRPHNVAPGAKYVGDARVRDEIDVALAVAHLEVREPVPLLGERADRLREQAHTRRLDRELPALARGQRALGLDDVPHVQVVEPLVLGAELVLADEELELARAIAQPQEREPAGRPERDHAPADVKELPGGERRDLLGDVLVAVLRGGCERAERREVLRV